MMNERPDFGKISNTSEDYLGTKALFPVKSLLIWGGIQLLALILNFAGALLKEKKDQADNQRNQYRHENDNQDLHQGKQRLTGKPHPLVIRGSLAVVVEVGFTVGQIGLECSKVIPVGELWHHVIL